MDDKRVSENKKNVLNLQKFLMDVCANPNKHKHDKELIKILGNQKTLSKYSNDGFELKPTSLNTLKRTCDKLFENGFDEIDRLRVLALNKLSEICDSPDEKDYSRSSLLAKFKQKELELEQQKKVSMICMSQLLETVHTLKNIDNSNNLNVIHMLSSDLLKKLTALSLHSTDFLPLKSENTNLRLVKGEDNE